MKSNADLLLSNGVSITWHQFDAGWYTKNYNLERELTGPKNALTHYLDYGAKIGNSPNPYFDERFYRLRHPGISEKIEAGKYRSGFDHYRRNSNSECQPHWLFDEKIVSAQIKKFAHFFSQMKGFENLYDAYLQVFDREKVRSSRFFCYSTFLNILNEEERSEALLIGPFKYYLRSFLKLPTDVAVSPYFDPTWYLRRYPEVRSEIESGIFANALHHYLSNDKPTHFDPLPVFSESFYLSQHEDVAIAVSKKEGIRNAFDHFLNSGIREFRNFHPKYNIKSHLKKNTAAETEIANGIYYDIFHHFLITRRDTDMASSVAIFNLPGCDPLLSSVIQPDLGERDALSRLSTLIESIGDRLQSTSEKFEQILRLLVLHEISPSVCNIFDGDKSQGLVSVIIPTKNRHHTITEAIESVLEQTFINWELLVISDGGDPLIQNAVQRYLHDPRIRFFEQPASGSAAARNLGLRYSKGDFIAYLDDDNLWNRKFLARMVYAFSESPEVDVAYGALVLDGRTGPLGDIRFISFDRTALLSGNLVDTNVLVHRRKVFEELGGWDETIDTYRDWELVLRYTQHKPALAVPVLGCYYRERDRNRMMSTVPSQSSIDSIQRRYAARSV